MTHQSSGSEVLTKVFGGALRLLDPQVREGGVPVPLDCVASVGLGLPVPDHHQLHLSLGSHHTLTLDDGCPNLYRDKQSKGHTSE